MTMVTRKFDDCMRTYDENGKLHSFNDNPAVVWEDGDKEWFIHGVKGRENDRHAEEKFYGMKTWFIDGKPGRMSGKNNVEFNDRIEWRIITESDTKFYRNHFVPHRLDGPAVIYNDGKSEWWVNGKRYMSEIDYKDAVSAYVIGEVMK